MFNISLGQFLVASIIAGVLGVSGFLIAPLNTDYATTIRIEPPTGVVVVGETFTIALIVDSNQPVNAFQGLLTFNPEILLVESIDYNTSIANLWAEEPWYSNGSGTINFIGGTTKIGGFLGEGTLLTVTFKTKQLGEASIKMNEAKILKHDGLGTEAPLEGPIDSLFTVLDQSSQTTILLDTSLPGPVISILPELPHTDLNGDGEQTIADVSIFMSHLVTQDNRSDFNQDGSVDLKDLSILTKQ